LYQYRGGVAVPNRGLFLALAPVVDVRSCSTFRIPVGVSSGVPGGRQPRDCRDLSHTCVPEDWRLWPRLNHNVVPGWRSSHKVVLLYLLVAGIPASSQVSQFSYAEAYIGSVERHPGCAPGRRRCLGKCTSTDVLRINKYINIHPDIMYNGAPNIAGQNRLNAATAF